MKENYESNIWKYYIFMFIASFEVTAAIYVLYMLQNELSMTLVMFLEVIFIVGTIILQIPAGAFADFYGRKKSITISILASGIAFMIYGIGSTFQVYLFASLAMSISFAFWFGASSAFLYDTLKQAKKEKLYPKVLGIVGFIDVTVLSVAALIGTAIAPFIGYKNLFYISASFFILAALITLSFKEPKRSTKLKDVKYFMHIKQALYFAWTHKIIRNLIIYFSLFGAMTHLAWFILQPYYDAFKISSIFIGIGLFAYFMPFGIGMLLAEKIIPLFRPKTLIYATLGISGICFAVMYFPFPLFSLLPLAIMSFVSGIRNIIVDKEINLHTSSHRRATVISLQTFSKNIMYAAFAPLLGFSSDAIGINETILFIGLVLIIFLAVIVLLFRKVKLEPTQKLYNTPKKPLQHDKNSCS